MVKFEQEYEKGKRLSCKTNWRNDQRGTMKLTHPDPSILRKLLSILVTLCQLVRELSFLNKGITITFTDKEN
jgi:DNA gyrase subunit B